MHTNCNPFRDICMVKQRCYASSSTISSVCTFDLSLQARERLVYKIIFFASYFITCNPSRNTCTKIATNVGSSTSYKIGEFDGTENINNFMTRVDEKFSKQTGFLAKSIWNPSKIPFQNLTPHFSLERCSIPRFV